MRTKAFERRRRRATGLAWLVVGLLVEGVLGVATGAAAPASAQTTSIREHGAQADVPIAPALSGLGTLHMPVTTGVARAQLFFDQGLRLLYAFNHTESIRAFREAERLDPSLAMAAWGQALALGPNLNAPMTVEHARLAFQAVARARRSAAQASERERALIEALAQRYAALGVGATPGSATRVRLDKAYAAAMKAVAARFPGDPDIRTLDADATMNTMPWDYWQKGGEPKPETARLMASIESVLAAHPDHVGALHYHLHLLEASNDPDRAEASADRLGPLMPAAGHMVHMPAHIYLRVGRYADAAEANVRAIAADEDYLAQCQAQGLYPLSYYPHNLHFLWTAATLEGRAEVAVEAARKLAEKVPHHHAGALAWTTDFPVTPMLAYVRFGRWQEILTEPMPPASAPYAIGIWRYARGLAFVARGQLDRAASEREALKAAMAHRAFATTLKDLPLLANLQIGAGVLEGEIEARRGHAGRAIAALRRAVATDDAFPYSEPPLWHQPPRQVLGAILLESGQASEAEAVYREDLARVRENGWSLFGLKQSLEAQGRGEEAAVVAARFATAWSRADITLSSSRIMTSLATDAEVARPAHGPHAHAGRAAAGTAASPRLDYVESGKADGLPVILLHGYTDSRRSFDRVLPLLPGSLRVFALSQRGHGDSERPASGYAPDDFAADVAAFMDAKGLGQAVIVGHSMGSIVAQRFALDFPQRTRALVLVSGFVPGPMNSSVGELWREVMAFGDQVDPAFVRAFQESTTARPVPAALLDTAVSESLKVPARVWKATLQPYADLGFASALGRIRTPTLIIWGDRDGFTSRAEQDTLGRAIAGSQLVVYEGTGHAPNWEEPARFADDVSRFISTLHAH